MYLILILWLAMKIDHENALQYINYHIPKFANNPTWEYYSSDHTDVLRWPPGPPKIEIVWPSSLLGGPGPRGHR